MSIWQKRIVYFYWTCLYEECEIRYFPFSKVAPGTYIHYITFSFITFIILEPSRAPVNVVIENGPMDNSLLVSWDKLYCDPGEPFIAFYNIQYMNLEDGLQNG